MKQHDMPLNILLVEDNAVNQKIITLMLESLGHQVTIAEDGQEAVDMYDSSRFELILMDVQMPVMDGFEATLQIRNKEQETGVRVPIVALTANVIADDQGKCLKVGMDGYLEKPLTKDTLLKALEEVVVKDVSA